jgi:NAD(P)-dependent dehydrogenase (short-subunit alcohol dehydrogenase family)
MSVLDRFRLDGKRLFIAGGSRGLGREMALAIADAGADVVLVGRDGASLKKTVLVTPFKPISATLTIANERASKRWMLTARLIF